MTDFQPQDVLDFWFPDDGHWTSRERHGAFWDQRMQGGMDADILARFGPLTEAAARGLLDHWADTPWGRLALIIALDQFPRSYWRNTPGAYAQDIRACRLALAGIANGEIEAMKPWEKAFFIISISHCEGPDHMERLQALDGLAARIAAEYTGPLEEMGPGFVTQHERVKDILARFGRHPHRNAILGRVSTPDEETYIATGDFPHVRRAVTG